MASAIVCEDNSRRELRTSARSKNMNYTEVNDIIDKSSECKNSSIKKSKPKKRATLSVMKNNAEIVHKCDEHLSTQNTVEEVTDNSKKLFPIFSSLTISKSPPNSRVCEDVDRSDKNVEQFNNVTQKEVTSFDKDNHEIIEEKSAKVEITAHHKRKNKKSKKPECKVTVVQNSADKTFIPEDMSTKLFGKEISKEPHNNLSFDKTGNPEYKGEKNENVSIKRKGEKSNKNKDISGNSEESTLDLPAPKTVNTKKQSITEFFQKVENKQNVKNSDNKSKLFPIFNCSPIRQNGKPTDNSSPEVKKNLPKKRKVDKLVEPIMISAIGTETNVLKPDNNYKTNVMEVVFHEISSPDIIDPLISSAQPMPAKRLRKISKKELKTNKTFSAAVLRSCNSKSNRSQINKEVKVTNLNEASASSPVENLEESTDVAENAFAKTSRKKIKQSAFKMLPQSHKILKGYKDKSKLKVKIKTAAKLFPLFLKSPTALAKKKSIERINLLAKKRVEGNAGVKLLDTKSNNITKGKIKKRGRPRKLQTLTLSPMKSLTEIKSLDKYSNELVAVDSISNISDVDEKVKRKSGRPKKDPSSKLPDSATDVKDILPNESIEIDASSNVVEVNNKVKKKPGAVESSVLSVKNSPEDKEMSNDLPNELIEMKVVSADKFERIKRKSGKQRKETISIISLKKTESTEVKKLFEPLSSEKIEIDISENKIDVSENSRRKSLRPRKVQSYSSPKSPTEMKEMLKGQPTEIVKELKHQKKKDLGTAANQKVILVADLVEKSKKVQKSASSGKNLNEIGKCPKKVLPDARVIVESSDESVEEINEPNNLNRKDINSKNADDANCSDRNCKKVNVHSKKIEKYIPFPLYSHCFQVNTTTEVTKQCNSKYVLKDEDVSDINIPTWNNIIGITEVKTIAPAVKMNKITEGSIKDLSTASNSDEKNNTLWTNIANDYNLKEVVSESTISDLTLWLKQWKSKFTKSAKRKHDKDDSFDSFSCDSNDSDADGLSNSVILMGPPGSGKTSLVFSLASEHGFKVLEVNASSCRSGRNISHQLKEALESYHVENLKASDIKVLEEKEVLSISTQSEASKKQINKGIASFFQKDKSCPMNVKEVNKTSSVKNFFQTKSSLSTKPQNKKSKVTSKLSSNQLSNQNIEASKEPNPYSISSQTIILFDDIDVVFQEDEGFWSTIRGFLKISKKPVIFTVSRNLDIVQSNLDLDIRILHLKPMISEIAIQKLQDQLKSNKRENKYLNIDLLTANSNDVRRNLLHAQFWSQFASNQSGPINEKFPNINTFFLGSLDCPADLDYFASKPQSNACNLISDYHQIGYDILHTNLFSLFNVNDGQKVKRQWQIVTKRSEEETQNDFDSKPETVSGIPKSDLWQEACKIFEFKKRALKNGSSSQDLFLFSNILEDFSLADTLKGHFSKNTNWISLPERLKKWTLGMPMCNDTNSQCPHNFTLDAISSIQVLRLKKAQNSYSKQHELVQDKCKTFVLEHSFPNFDNTDGNETEKQVEIIASAVPANLSISKSILNLDYLSTLKIMCQDELIRQARTGKRSNRFLHYFDSISLLLEKQQIELILQ